MQEQLEKWCKHISKGDNAFTARMRFHQSWYRKYMLGLPPGPNPHARNELYGNMLCKNDGMAGHNFINETIHEFAEKRLAEDATHIESSRLRNNLLSSQPFCFNLFAPLALDITLATRLIKTLRGLNNLSLITQVKLEFAPPKEFLLEDGTSFDAWIEYKHDGGYGFIGIETKLTEPFSQKHYNFQPSYRRWKYDDSWWWVTGAEKMFSNTLYNQLWRNHLLAFALQHQKNSRYSECYNVVLYHQMDKQCLKSIKAYRELILPQYQATLLEWPLDQLYNEWSSLSNTTKEKSWFQALYLRYLDMDASEEMWQQYRRTT